MAKMRSRTEALVNAYLNNYQNANATTVSGGQSAQQSAQSRGSAIMNATDKTLPTLKDYSADVLNGIVKSADNAQSAAISNFKLAKKQIEAEQKAAEKAAKAAAKSTVKSGRKKSSKKSSSTSSSTDDTSGGNTSLDSLFGDGENASTSSTNSQKSSGGNYSKTRTNEERNASARARYDDSKQEKSDIKYRAQQKAAATQKALEEKQAAANAGANKGKTTGKTYAEQKNAGNAAAPPAQSRATGKAGNIIGSTAAATGQAQSAAETQAAKDKRNDYKSRQEDIAAALKKLQTDADYRTELARPGRKLTGAEIQAVKEYNQKPGNLYKQVQAGELSLDDYNEQGQELARMNQKASLGGLGQDMQAFTAGLMTSVPFVKQVDSAIKDYANKATNGQYEKALESGVVPDFLQALENSKEQNRIAAGAGTMAGKAAQYSLFNNLMEGTPLAETMGKVGGKVAGAASKVPVLGQFATPAAGDALGRILTDQTADTVLDTIPSLVNDLQTYDDQQSRIKNGEQVDNALTPGQIGLNTLGNVAQNFAFNAIPEVGGAVLNRLKGTAGDAAQDVLKQADDAAQDVQKSVPARNIVQPEANGTTGLSAQIQQMNTPDAANRSALNTLDELRGQVDLNGAQEKEAEQLRRAVLQRQQEIGDEAKAALQNSDNLPIDGQGAKAYNEINGGVVNDNLGAGVRADVPGIADSRASNELQPGNLGDGISGQAAEGGQNSTASVLGRGVQGNDAKSAAQVAEWAKSITGKGRQSVYTRRIENLYNQMQNGASREGMAEEAANIAAGLVKESDFAEPLDEVTSALREYMKRTPIRLDEKAEGDILYTSGLKNIQQYNFQNGTKFSLTDGIPYDTAMQELGEMGVGVNGSSVDDLLKAVDASNAKPLVDSDQAAAYSDYLRDRILDGPSDTQMGAEDFADWLDVQSFDRDAPDYVQRLLERDNIPALNQTAETVSEPVPGMGTANSARQAVQEQPLNGSESLPTHSVGANKTQYNRVEALNQDYGVQRAMGGKIDADEAAAAGIGQQTHTVYSRAEGKDTAKHDFDLLVQQNGDILSAGRTVADELTRKSADGNFDASDVYRGYYAADQLQNMLNSYEKGSADAQLVQAQIENLNRAVSAGQSKNAQALSAGRWAQIDEYTPIRKFEQITQRKVNDFAKTRDGKQLESLATDVVEMAKSGPQDEEFTAFLKAQGVDVGDNPLNAQMDDLAKRIKSMADTKGVKATDEQAKSAAASILAGGNADDVFNAMARKSLGIENLSQEDYDYVKNAFAEIADMPDSKARYEKELDAYKRLTKYMPAKTFGDKMESIRYLSMLGNTRTHARNVLGNVSMGVVTRAKDNVSGVMQLALPKDQRTKAVGTTLTADGRKMVDLAKEYGQNKMYSVLYNDGKFNAESGLRAAQDTFTSKPGKVIQKAADINSALLEKEDNIFLTSAFGNAMASQLKARGYDSSVFTATDAKSKQALVDAAATALRDAKEATFHEDNFLSTALKNYQNDIKGHGVGGKILWAVGEGVLPFKKTPLNIAKNAMEYNIVGGTVEAAYRYASGASSADVIDAAAKGLTGTALMGIGGILAYNGLLNGSKSGDDRADAFDEMTGKQEYSINIPGKGTYTIDWASPASVPLLMGAEIANEWQNGGLSVTKFLDAARKIGNPILDTTMLQGLNDTLDSVSYADSDDKLGTLITGTLSSYAQQYVPTALGQIARTIDPLRRSPYGGGDTRSDRDFSYNVRKMENKIPGLSMTNEPYIDQWGREQKSLDGTDDSAGGYALRGIYNTLSPGYLRQENVTPVDEYLQELYGSTNDSHVLPEKASSKITVDSENYYMTPEEKTEYAKTSGQTAYDIIDSLRQNDMFLKLPEDQQSALVQDAYSVAKTVGGVAAVGDGVSGTGSKAYEAYQQGGVPTLESYLLAKNATDIARDEKREMTGSDTASLDTVETWNTLYSQFFDDAVDSFVNSTSKDSTVRNISDLAGDKAVTAYMQSYSAVSKTLDDGQTPNKFTVGYGMQQYGLSGNDFAKAYLAAYYKKTKDGSYPDKGSSYVDKAGADIYQQYGADALQSWVNYRATIEDANGNGKVDKDEAIARLNEMSLTNELRRAYLTNTNKSWKNPY